MSDHTLNPMSMESDSFGERLRLGEERDRARADVSRLQAEIAALTAELEQADALAKLFQSQRDTECARAEQAEQEIDRLREELHYCKGTCDLAMKHRDIAEAEVAKHRELIEKAQQAGCNNSEGTMTYVIPDNERAVLHAVMRQAEIDLKSAHAEICKLQNLDSSKHEWPHWSTQANSLRWFDAIREKFPAPPDPGRLVPPHGSGP